MFRISRFPHYNALGLLLSNIIDDLARVWRGELGFWLGAQLIKTDLRQYGLDLERFKQFQAFINPKSK